MSTVSAAGSPAPSLGSEGLTSSASTLTTGQTDVLRDLVRKMRFVGAFFVLVGVLRMLYDGLVASEPHLDITFLLDVLIGIWTLSAGRAFGRAATQHGPDVERLMEGLGDIRKLYSLIYWLLIIAVALLAVLLGLGLSAFDLGLPFH
jgi:hypothetical protein